MNWEVDFLTGKGWILFGEVATQSNHALLAAKNASAGGNEKGGKEHQSQ